MRQESTTTCEGKDTDDQSKVIKDEDERVLVDDLKILERWREYYQKLMNDLTTYLLKCGRVWEELE